MHVGSGDKGGYVLVHGVAVAVPAAEDRALDQCYLVNFPRVAR